MSTKSIRTGSSAVSLSFALCPDVHPQPARRLIAWFSWSFAAEARIDSARQDSIRKTIFERAPISSKAPDLLIVRHF